MYKSRNGQQSLLEDARAFGGVRLDPENALVKLAGIIPWEWFEAEYAATFAGSVQGNPAKPARMALGTLLIKEQSPKDPPSEPPEEGDTTQGEQPSEESTAGTLILDATCASQAIR